MLKISNKEIIDIIKFSESKVIFVEKKPFGDLSQYKANYFILNFETGEKEVVTKSAYLMRKFGPNYEKITESIANYVQCDVAVLTDKNVLVIFPNGQTGLFDSAGGMKWNGTLKYNDKIVSGIATDNDYFWSCCKDENCVIRYSSDNIKVDIRIGGKEATTFTKPDFVSADDEYIYVCCDGLKVRKIDKSNFTVSDVKGSYIGLKKFYKLGKFSIICTSDGAYIDKD
ncbi:MAG: hypothetical protein ACLUFN_07160 [Eubacterium sp.]